MTEPTVTTPTPNSAPPLRCTPAWRARRRRNTLEAAALFVFMLVLGPALGTAFPCVYLRLVHGVDELDVLIPPALRGFTAGLVWAVLAGLWAWFLGPGAILWLTGARRVRATDIPRAVAITRDLAERAGIRPPRLYLIDDTALSAMTVAPPGRRCTIALSTGLVATAPDDELRAVLAHEVSHAACLDSRFSTLLSTTIGLFALACDACWRAAFDAARAGKRSSDTIKHMGWISIVFFVAAGVLSLAGPALGVLIQLIISRDREYFADARAAELTGDARTLARALTRLAADDAPLVEVASRATAHLFIVNPLRPARMSHQSVDSPWCSHPPIESRIKRLQTCARETAAA